MLTFAWPDMALPVEKSDLGVEKEARKLQESLSPRNLSGNLGPQEKGKSSIAPQHGSLPPGSPQMSCAARLSQRGHPAASDPAGTGRQLLSSEQDIDITQRL